MIRFQTARRAILGTALAAGLSAAAAADTASRDMGDALGAVRAIFYHELGHALIDVLDLDVVGSEETAVDEFSTMLLILQGRRDPRHIEALLAAARFWYLVGDPTEEARRFWSAHDFSARRGFAIVCLLHGSDPARFRSVMRELGVGADVRDKCERAYAEKAENWINLLSPHAVPNAPEDRDGALVVDYGPARTEATDGVRRVWRQAGFLEGLAREAGEIFPLPGDLPVTARDCGEANAFWDGTSVILCYELQDMIVGLFAAARDGEAAPAASAPGRDGAAEAVAQPPAGQGARNIGGMLGGE